MGIVAEIPEKKVLDSLSRTHDQKRIPGWLSSDQWIKRKPTGHVLVFHLLYYHKRNGGLKAAILVFLPVLSYGKCVSFTLLSLWCEKVFVWHIFGSCNRSQSGSYGHHFGRPGQTWGTKTNNKQDCEKKMLTFSSCSIFASRCWLNIEENAPFSWGNGCLHSE